MVLDKICDCWHNFVAHVEPYIPEFVKQPWFYIPAALIVVLLLFRLRKHLWSSLAVRFIVLLFHFRNKDFVGFLERHERLFEEAKRIGDHKKCTQNFYDLMEELLEFYYGPCWHFAPPDHWGQRRADAVASLHNRIARLLGLAPGHHSLDIGCGIGGIMQDMAIYSGANITGLTLADTEVRRGNELFEERGLQYQCHIRQGDAQYMPFADNSFDSAYAVYAAKYLTTLDKMMDHVYRVLKPGGKFLIYCIVKTDKYDINNEDHVRTVAGFEYSCGMPSLHTFQGMVDAAQAAKLQCVTRMDVSTEVPWYYEFDQPAFEFFVSSPISRAFLRVLEFFWILPKGFTNFVKVIVYGNSMGIVHAGRKGILTGSAVLVFQKPLDGSTPKVSARASSRASDASSATAPVPAPLEKTASKTPMRRSSRKGKSIVA